MNFSNPDIISTIKFSTLDCSRTYCPWTVQSLDFSTPNFLIKFLNHDFSNQKVEKFMVEVWDCKVPFKFGGSFMVEKSRVKKFVVENSRVEKSRVEKNMAEISRVELYMVDNSSVEKFLLVFGFKSPRLKLMH